MRNLGDRPNLTGTVAARLVRQTGIVASEPEPTRAAKARLLFDNARKTKWFADVVRALTTMVGPGQCCMYCSGSEASEVDHYRPIKHFPDSAFNYKNYVWACHICNNHKGQRLPPDTEAGGGIVNPIDDDVWDHFLFEPRFGRLICRVDPTTREPLHRAKSTFAVVGIDRQALQDRRQQAYDTLKREVSRLVDEIAEGCSVDARAELVKLRGTAFQPDVADFFLNGPGRRHEPFGSLLRAAGEEPST